MLLPGTADTSIQTEDRMYAKTDLRPTAGYQLALLGGTLGRQAAHVIAGVSDYDSKEEPVVYDWRGTKHSPAKACLLFCNTVPQVSVSGDVSTAVC